MSETPTETRLGSGGAPQPKGVTCAACGHLFAPTGGWKQRFCTPKCRNDYHGKLTAESLRRDLDELRRQVAALKATLEQVSKDADRRDATLRSSTES